MTNYHCWTTDDLRSTSADLEDYLETETDPTRRRAAELQLDLITNELESPDRETSAYI